MAYIRHGCVVARGVIDLAAIAMVRSITEQVYARTQAEHVYDPEIAEATQGRQSGFELISHPLLRRFMALVFSGQRYRRESATARRIRPRGGDAHWQEPLELHVDSFFHQFWFTVNFWIPFDECGVEAPGLQLLPVDYRETRRYSRFSRQPIYSSKPTAMNGCHFPEPNFKVKDLEADFGTGCLFRPHMKPGDVVVASNWIVHGSYRTDAMANGRTSMELRYIGTCPDIAVRPDRVDRYWIGAHAFSTRIAVLAMRSKTGLPFWAERM